MPRDTDGTNWVTVVLTTVVDVIADTTDEAMYQAYLKLPDLIGAGNEDLWEISVPNGAGEEN